MAARSSRRANILAGLQRTLQSITTTNGYSRNVREVTFAVRSWQSLPEAETPVIFIIDDATDYKYYPGRLTERSWTIQLFGVMKGADQLQMEEFIADIEMALVNNERLKHADLNNGAQVCNHIRIMDVVTDNQLFAQFENSQLFKITCQINYTCSVDSIR